MKDYFVATAHWYVPYRLIWADWFASFEDDYYYDVWF